MTNFVLVDAPNFVLLVPAPQAAQQASPGEPEYLNPLFTELIRLLGVSLTLDRLASPVTFDDAAALKMRRILARYGFDLPPLTLGELYSLFEYCDRLDAITGKASFARHQQAQWRQLTFALGCGDRTPCQRALDMYANGDMQGLRALHREQGTLAQLGRQYRPPEG
jgi:hypothetical protein